ncbi:MAG: LytTR family DNA-binding domain-containing protein [Bacilli bacterium]
MNKKLKIVLLDDDVNSIDILYGAVLSTFVNKNQECEAKKATNRNDFLLLLDSFNPDLLLLDIDMPDGDGIELAKYIQTKGNKAAIIFVSSREDRVFDSFNVHPFGFVRKSNFAKDFSTVVDSFLLQFTKNGDKSYKLIIQCGASSFTISTKELIYIEGQAKYQMLYLEKDKEPIRVRLTMDYFENKLNNKGFIRVHKGFLVNIAFIRVINDDAVILTDGRNLLISKRKVVEIRKEYLRKMQETDQVLYIKP